MNLLQSLLIWAVLETFLARNQKSRYDLSNCNGHSFSSGVFGLASLGD